MKRTLYVLLTIVLAIVAIVLHLLTIMGWSEAFHGAVLPAVAGFAAFVLVGLSDVSFFFVAWHRFGLANGITALWAMLIALWLTRLLLCGGNVLGWRFSRSRRPSSLSTQ